VSKSIHQWQTYYSPRNGRVKIQACRLCGVAKGIVTSSYGCKPNSKTRSILKNWTTEVPGEESASSITKRPSQQSSLNDLRLRRKV